jgi:ribosome-binding factor A
MRYKRSDRVAALLLRELAGMVERNQTKWAVGLITLTAAEVTDDLRHAKIYVVARGSEEQKRRALEKLDRAAGHMRHELGKVLDLKYIPTLGFFEDESFDRADRIHRLLDEIREEESP